MNQKKLLVISPVPTHPLNQGNRRRIFNMLSSLRKLGFHITYVYFHQPLVDSNPFDLKAMRECWDRFYFVQPRQSLAEAMKRRFIAHLGGFLKKRLPALYIKAKGYYKIPDFMTPDSIHSIVLDNFLRKLSKERFDAVLLQYIFSSKSLELFPDTLKVIDTHDVFTDKHKMFIDKLKEYGGVSATKEQEARAISRADVVIAIQDKEKEFFSTLTRKKIVTVGHLVPEIKSSKTFRRKNLLFVGVVHPPNVHGIKYFIKESWPLIRKKFPDAKLLLAGRICDAIEDDSVTKLGVLKDIEFAYDLADAVISPIYIGTGLKIKNIEALSYCKPLITTSCCAKELDAKNAYLIADTPEEFADAVARIFSSKKFAEKLSKNAEKFMKKYNDNNLETLKEIFKC